MTVRTALAPAKINLFLHVGPLDGDGYHPLSSLVAFADVGDRVSVEPAARLSLDVVGPFAAGLSGADDNLILRALRRLGETVGAGEGDKSLMEGDGTGRALGQVVGKEHLQKAKRVKPSKGRR